MNKTQLATLAAEWRIPGVDQGDKRNDMIAVLLDHFYPSE